MTHRPAFAPLVLLVAVTLAHADPAPALRIEDLGWMAGDWEMVSGDTRIEEHWTRPAGGTMVGMGRTLRGPTTAFFEYLRLETRPDGIYYVAHPQARPGTDFKLVRHAAQEAVFENPAHDFPQRITYRREADGGLFACVEGDAQGTEPPEEYRYRPMRP
ncbi:MAG TPA: DUF6265 family protein [Candidatus Polarisedimenticolaceae bacterium]|nr:DUF6265 family protein [Candidatus Polarisedimenticolaceae bacterium]